MKRVFFLNFACEEDNYLHMIGPQVAQQHHAIKKPLLKEFPVTGVSF